MKNPWSYTTGVYYQKYMMCRRDLNDPVMVLHYWYELLQYKQYYYMMFLACLEKAEEWNEREH